MAIARSHQDLTGPQLAASTLPIAHAGRVTRRRLPARQGRQSAVALRRVLSARAVVFVHFYRAFVAGFATCQSTPKRAMEARLLTRIAGLIIRSDRGLEPTSFDHR